MSVRIGVQQTVANEVVESLPLTIVIESFLPKLIREMAKGAEEEAERVERDLVLSSISLVTTPHPLGLTFFLSIEAE